MSRNRRHVLTHGRIARLLYFVMVILSFYFLSVSRSGEVYTVWQVMHPLFMPTFFATTFLLLAIIFSSEKAEYKLLFIIVHSILSQTLFVIAFPAGNVGVQQTALGEARLVFDNVVSGGYRFGGNPLTQIYHWGRKGLQIPLTVIFARIFAVDIYWVHLLFIPVLWGTFVPITTFMICETLSRDKRLSALSSILVSAFPANILWGAASLPMALGYILFFLSTYLLLKNLRSDGVKGYLPIITSCIATFLAHFLAGILLFSLLLLATALKSYQRTKEESPITAKTSLLLSIIFCISILPFALIIHRFFYPSYTFFSLEKIYELPPTKTVTFLLLGGYVNFDLHAAVALFSGPLIGFLGMIYALRSGIKKKSNSNDHVYTVFLFIAFLIILLDDRIVNLFMVNVPFTEPDRLWPFRNFIVTPFVALAVTYVSNYLRKKTLSHPTAKEKLQLPKSPRIQASVNLKHITAHLTILILLSAWLTSSVYHAYPHYAPLQTTTYELEAVKYIEENTPEKYIVICDQWIIYAGGMFVGVSNPRAFYFSSEDPRGVALFMEMKENPTNETMIKAMKTNNATTAYFIIEQRRLGTHEYDRIIQQAQQNNLQTYHVFSYNDVEKLRIFYYKNSTSW